MIFGISGTKKLSIIERCPYYRDVRKELEVRLYKLRQILP